MVSLNLMHGNEPVEMENIFANDVMKNPDLANLMFSQSGYDKEWINSPTKLDEVGRYSLDESSLRSSLDDSIFPMDTSSSHTWQSAESENSLDRGENSRNVCMDSSISNMSQEFASDCHKESQGLAYVPGLPPKEQVHLSGFLANDFPIEYFSLLSECQHDCSTLHGEKYDSNFLKDILQSGDGKSLPIGLTLDVQALAEDIRNRSLKLSG